MKLTKEMIKFVLGEESSTRNNDQLLYDKARSIYALSDDNIVADSNLLTRVRRDLQRKGLYECTIPEVKKRR